jgi:glucose-6-phosphate isomerase
MTPISYNFDSALLGENELSKQHLLDLTERLNTARARVKQDLGYFCKCDGKIPKDEDALDTAFVDLPERLLGAERSTVDRTNKVARQLAEQLDDIVLLGIGGSYMGARALFEACCHPYHNEMPPNRRQYLNFGSANALSEPLRIYFEGNNVDNDAMQGLLDMLESRGAEQGRAGRWGIVAISKSGGTRETAVALRVFLRKLGGDSPAEYMAAITGLDSKLFNLATRGIGCGDELMFEVPSGVGGRFSVLSPVGLLPAALMGLDIEKLLAGARDMTTRFFDDRIAIEDNPVLAYTGVSHLHDQRGRTIRVLSVWSQRLEAAGFWYDQLLSESLGKNQREGATPITAVTTRDLHSRGQQHQEGREDKLITNVVVNEPQSKPIEVGKTDFGNDDDLDWLAKATVPEIMQAAIEGTNAAYKTAKRPTATIELPALDEYSMGQFFQMMMLATVVEGRMIGVNPYGQPGVEAYKKNMDDKLEERFL